MCDMGGGGGLGSGCRCVGGNVCMYVVGEAGGVCMYAVGEAGGVGSGWMCVVGRGGRVCSDCMSITD